ncbi:SF3A3 [Symbiodinium microadriaticum]|nr:SF3A3 [Symbiodinium microadriaticum]
MDINPEESMEVEVHVAFSGEEIFGKYLDLHSFYVQYCNLPNIPSHDVDYLQYLDKFNSFFYIPENSKSHKAYVQYISSLWEYLLDFFRRVQPLVEVEDLLAEWRAAFEKKWSVGDVSGWAPPRKSGGGDSQALRLGMFNSKDELEALGLDRLKGAMEALGLKCGGTLSDRADRLWSVRGVKPNDIPDKLKAKAKRAGSADNSGDSARKKTALLEYLIQSLCSLMAEIVTATRRHAEKQQTRTLEEKLALLEEEEYGTLPDVEEADDDEDDEGPLYNPLNLPLGWDGKPIPFWLYKLHGLGVEFKCEICGNQSYWGRRAFDRHFQEWRHAHGMRCLGVPNTKHFHDITLIEDALALYSKIRDSLKKEQFVEDVEEEFEDSEGNVLNRRTYEDLARQGLL